MTSRSGQGINYFVGVTAELPCEEAQIQGRVEKGHHLCNVRYLLFLCSHFLWLVHVHDNELEQHLLTKI